MSADPQERNWNRLGWWAIWFATLVVSLVPPLAHHLCGVAKILEPFRYSRGHLPPDLQLLRQLGELSRWIPVALCGILIVAARKPTLRKSAIACGACMAAGFSAVYAGYCLMVLTIYLPSYSNAMEGRNDLIQWRYVKRTKAEKGVAPDRSSAPSLKSTYPVRRSED